MNLHGGQQQRRKSKMEEREKAFGTRQDEPKQIAASIFEHLGYICLDIAFSMHTPKFAVQLCQTLSFLFKNTPQQTANSDRQPVTTARGKGTYHPFAGQKQSPNRRRHCKLSLCARADTGVGSITVHTMCKNLPIPDRQTRKRVVVKSITSTD